MVAFSRTFRLLSSSTSTSLSSSIGGGISPGGGVGNAAATPPGGVVRWGILSAGRIASDYVKAMSVSSDGAEATAVAARSSSRASAFATTHSIPKWHGSYPELISDPNVDVVYVGTIADHHLEWARESLLAGKPTVVEKPMTLTYDDTRDLVGLARERNVFLMEGMWTRCFPAMKELRRLVASGAVGPIVYVQADFGWSFPEDAPDNRIWLPDSGGVTLDVGMYAAQLGRVAFPNATLKDVRATGTVKNGVDHSVVATVSYDRGNDGPEGSSRVGDGILQMALTGAANTEERCVLQGTRGRIVVDGPFHVPRRLRVLLDEGRGTDDDESSSNEAVYEYPLPRDPYGTWNNPGSIAFVHQIEEVGRALREGRKECESFTWEDSLEVARIVDEIVYQVRGEREIVASRRERSGGAGDDDDWMEEEVQAGSS